MTNSLTPEQQVFYHGNGYEGVLSPDLYDLTVNPHFKAYLARGVDRHKRNPVGTPSAEKLGRTNFKAVGLEEAGRG